MLQVAHSAPGATLLATSCRAGQAACMAEQEQHCYK